MGAEVTRLLTQASRGDEAAIRRLAPLVYEELRRLARHYLPKGGTPAGTLQPTALVHEAFLRLLQQETVDYKSRTHFLALAATAMRSVLADHVRAHGAAKRGGGWCRITLDRAVTLHPNQELDMAALDEALTRLAGLKERAVKIVELRFFGGLSVEEVADHLGVSARTVKEDWRVARAWLRSELAEAS